MGGRTHRQKGYLICLFFPSRKKRRLKVDVNDVEDDWLTSAATRDNYEPFID
jgi:hypothetical protein